MRKATLFSLLAMLFVTASGCGDNSAHERRWGAPQADTGALHVTSRA